MFYRERLSEGFFQYRSLLDIFTSTHIIFTPIHLHIHTCHLVIFASFHLDIFTSWHLHTSFPLLDIFSSHTCTPSHLKISSWYLHILSSSLLHISPVHLVDSTPHSFKSDLIMFTSSHLHIHHMSFKHNCYKYHLFTSIYIYLIMWVIYVSFRSWAIRHLVLKQGAPNDKTKTLIRNRFKNWSIPS